MKNVEQVLRLSVRSLLFNFQRFYHDKETFKVKSSISGFLQRNIDCRNLACPFVMLYIAFQGAATTCYVALHPDLKGVSGKYFADCNLAETSKQANDQELSKKLWDFTLNIINGRAA